MTASQQNLQGRTAVAPFLISLVLVTATIVVIVGIVARAMS